MKENAGDQNFDALTGEYWDKSGTLPVIKAPVTPVEPEPDPAG
jgi:hypothetical protein